MSLHHTLQPPTPSTTPLCLPQPLSNPILTVVTAHVGGKSSDRIPSTAPLCLPCFSLSLPLTKYVPVHTHTRTHAHTHMHTHTHTRVLVHTENSCSCSDLREACWPVAEAILFLFYVCGRV